MYGEGFKWCLERRGVIEDVNGCKWVCMKGVREGS